MPYQHSPGKLIEIELYHQKSIKIDNHKKFCDRLLSISDICRLIYSIDFYRQQSFLSTIGIIDMLRPGSSQPPTPLPPSGQ